MKILKTISFPPSPSPALPDSRGPRKRKGNQGTEGKWGERGGSFITWQFLGLASPLCSRICSPLSVIPLLPLHHFSFSSIYLPSCSWSPHSKIWCFHCLRLQSMFWTWHTGLSWSGPWHSLNSSLSIAPTLRPNGSCHAPLACPWMGLTPQIAVCMQRKYKHLQLSTRGPRMNTVQGLVPHTPCSILSATECWQNSRTLPTSLSEKMAFLYFLLLVRSPTHRNGSTQLGGTWQSWALTPDLSIRVLVREHEFEIRNSGQIDLKYYLVFQPLSSILPVDTWYFTGGKIEYPERPNTLPMAT